MQVAGKEIVYKKSIPLLKERDISIGLQSLGAAIFVWLGSAETAESAAEYQKLNEQWQKLAAEFVEGPLPALNELGTEGLGEITRDFFGRAFNPKTSSS